MKITRAFALASAAVAVLANAAAANADTVVGQTAPPTASCSPGTLYQAGTGGAPGYATPAGVITSWTVQTDASVAPIKLKVLHAVGGGSYRIIGESTSVTPTANSTQTFQSRIPVGIGDYLGMSVLSGSADCMFSTANYTDAVRESSTVDPAVGSTITVPTSHPNSRLDVSAVVEPDRDGDGFGDTTQDRCPTDPSTQGNCAVDLSLKAVSIFKSPRVGQNITWSVTITNNSSTDTVAKLIWRLPSWVRIDSVISSGPCEHHRDQVTNEYIATCTQTFVARGTTNLLIHSTPLAPGFIVAHGSLPASQMTFADPNPSNNAVTARRFIFGSATPCANPIPDRGNPVLGSRAGDRIHGTAAADTVYGLDGPDCIWGSAGNDRLYGGAGADVIRGGAGNDQLWGGHGHDHLYGGPGDDVIHARGELDFIRCGAGNDTVYADLRDRVSRDCEKVIRARS